MNKKNKKDKRGNVQTLAGEAGKSASWSIRLYYELSVMTQ